MASSLSCPKCSVCIEAGKPGDTIKNWSKRVYVCIECSKEYPLSYTG